MAGLRKSLLGGQSGDPGDDRHDISSEEVLTDPELVRHEGFQDEGEGKSLSVAMNFYLMVTALRLFAFGSYLNITRPRGEPSPLCEVRRFMTRCSCGPLHLSLALEVCTPARRTME
ncbi:hypothetical protein QQF64_015995, partial [Cirrhinus molitorella]